MPYAIIFFVELSILFFLSRKTKRQLFKFLRSSLKSKKIATYIYSVLFLPGTIVHELSHLFVAVLLLVPVGKISILPKVKDGKIVLGSVEVYKTDPIRQFFVSTAPFIIGTLLILVSLKFIAANRMLFTTLDYFVAAYIIFEISNSMFLSKSDFKGALELSLLILIIYLILYILGLQPSIRLSDSLVDLLKQSTLFLLFPLNFSTLVSFHNCQGYQFYHLLGNTNFFQRANNFLNIFIS